MRNIVALKGVEKKGVRNFQRDQEVILRSRTACMEGRRPRSKKKKRIGKVRRHILITTVNPIFYPFFSHRQVLGSSNSSGLETKLNSSMVDLSDSNFMTVTVWDLIKLAKSY